eukprot:gb/GFBE01062486.1/.p1 GENE.gb/GFBE01062486.1/~~gb/GFBE01062486.1/.p1  ORF type:complete len:320 (+),score=67.88 gb/GFBE01062486.1/:1-960(+)
MMQLPPLPRLDDQHKLGQLLRGPTEYSNWVIPGRLMCGAYPGAFEDKKNDQNLKKILAKGVDTFYCMQDELDNDVPEEVWRSGIGYRPYFADAERLSRKELRWVQLPIPDGLVAPDDVTAELVVLLAEDIKAGRVVYLHCLGGHGRAAVICCLLLSYLYRITSAETLKRVQAYHDCRIDPQGAKSPQTVVQREQVRRQVQALLNCEAPEVDIQKELPRVVIDAGKRGSMMPDKKSSQSASAPTLATPTGSDSSEKHRSLRLKASVHQNAMPEYLQLQNAPTGAFSAKSRRDAMLRQKAMAAALRRKAFAKSESAAVLCF